jgi:putative ABC transport system permease protein
VPVIDGRWLNSADNALHLKSVVLGSGIAKQYGYLPGEIRTIRLNGTNFGVVGVLAPVALDPDLDNAAFVTQWAAKHVLGTNGAPNQLYIRAADGTTQATANAIPTAISLGGPDQVSTQIPSNVLQAAAQANRTLQEVALLAGLLALTVGGIGIANVMSISVIQRSAEIGIRRAVGHSRSKIAAQFLLESLFVGVLGGLLGAVLGVGVVYTISWIAGWVTVISYADIPIWMGLAIVVSVVAGLFPSIKAARLEPLETLRLG